MNCLISKKGSLGTAQHIGREGKLIIYRLRVVETEVKNQMILYS